MNNVKEKIIDSDFIFIEKLEALCRIGCTAEERAFPQIVTVDVNIFLPLDKSAQSSQLSDTVDYANVTDGIKNLLLKDEFKLLETAAERIAAFILKDEKTNRVTVRLHKKVFSDVKATGVFIQRDN